MALHPCSGEVTRRPFPMSPKDLLEAALLIYLRGLGLTKHQGRAALRLPHRDGWSIEESVKANNALVAVFPRHGRRDAGDLDDPAAELLAAGLRLCLRGELQPL
jgi:hypothetical protein